MVPGERHVRGPRRDPAGHRRSEPCGRVCAGGRRCDVHARRPEGPGGTDRPRELPGADAGQHAHAVGGRLDVDAPVAAPGRADDDGLAVGPLEQRPRVHPLRRAARRDAEVQRSGDHLLLRGELVTPIGGEPVRGPLARAELDDDRRHVGHRGLPDRRGHQVAAGHAGVRIGQVLPLGQQVDPWQAGRAQFHQLLP